MADRTDIEAYRQAIANSQSVEAYPPGIEKRRGMTTDETREEKLRRIRLERMINPPLIIPERCTLCGEKLNIHTVVPGELIGFQHAACIDKERERTKHLCSRPYQLPRRGT